MRYYSTKNPLETVSMREAVSACVPRDGGLYMPVSLPAVPKAFVQNMGGMSLQEIAYATTNVFMDADLDAAVVKKIVDTALSFDVPLVKLSPELYVLELFHGPTNVFKDIGARFLAGFFDSINPHDGTRLNVLVATSGNTGLAVASALGGHEDINVFLLYPRESVSRLDSAAMASAGENIYALEIGGSIDDCNAMVASAFADESLRENVLLSSANSTNFARLIPQVALYFYAVGRLELEGLLPGNVDVSVPSGNLGLLTSGLMAKRMGVSFGQFIGACNSNNAFYRYLTTGILDVRPTRPTLAPLMDLSVPSNFPRLLALCGCSVDLLRKDISAATVRDDTIIATIRKMAEEHNYIVDPHTAVGIASLSDRADRSRPALVMATAHPSKSSRLLSEILGVEIKTESSRVVTNSVRAARRPDRLTPTYPALRKYILSKQ